MITAFYPSMVVNLRLMFEPAFSKDVTTDELPVPLSIPDNLDAIPVKMFVKAKARPAIMAGQKTSLAHVAYRIPKTANVELMNFRQASTFSMTFAYKDLPIDPRLLKAIGVEVHLGAVPADDFAEGMRQNPDQGKPRKSVLALGEKTLLMVGIADAASVEHSDTMSEIQMSGRDLRGIFLNAPLDARLVKNLTLKNPIHKVVAEILAYHPLAEEFTVTADPNDWFDVDGKRIAIPSPKEKNNLTAVRLSSDKQTERGGVSSSSSDLNFWDLITQYCSLVGAVPYFIGERLHIRQARTLFDVQGRATFDPKFPTFENGNPRFINGKPVTIRQIIWGRNVRRLGFERKYTGTTPKIVMVRSFDTDAKILRKAYYPIPGVDTPKESGATTRGPSGSEAQTDILTVTKPGIKSEKVLRAIAQGIFQEIARGQLGGAFETRNLSSFGAGNEDPDMLRLRPGDPLDVRADVREITDGPPLASAYTDHRRRTDDEEIEFITARVGNRNLARAIVKTARNGVPEMDRDFRVGNVRYNWDASGIKISGDFHNYIVANYDQIEAGKETTDVKSKKTKGRHARVLDAPLESISVKTIQPRASAGSGTGENIDKLLGRG